jgi:hypothetical protein
LLVLSNPEMGWCGTKSVLSEAMPDVVEGQPISCSTLFPLPRNIRSSHYQEATIFGLR